MFKRVLRYLPYALLLAVVAVLLAGSTPAFTAGNSSPNQAPVVRIRSNGEWASFDSVSYDGCIETYSFVTVIRESPGANAPTLLDAGGCTYNMCTYAYTCQEGYGYIPSHDVQFFGHKQVRLYTDTTDNADWNGEAGVFAVEWIGNDESHSRSDGSYEETTNLGTAGTIVRRGGGQMEHWSAWAKGSALGAQVSGRGSLGANKDYEFVIEHKK